MRTDADIVARGKRDRVAHVIGVGAMEASGYIGLGDVRHQPFVITHFVKAEAFAHVAVDVDHHVGLRYLVGLCMAAPRLGCRLIA